jgi:hypothetical protein
VEVLKKRVPGPRQRHKRKTNIIIQMSLVRVWTDTGKGKPVALIAKIVDSNPPNYTIQYLSKTDEEYKGCSIWRYEDETYEIDDDSITEWMDTKDELEIGYKFLSHDPGAFVYYDSDGDYEPSDDEDSDDDSDGDDESLEEEDYDDYGEGDDEDCAWD